MSYYIANRLSHQDMAKIVPNVSRLNSGFSEVLRSLALKQGIKKTQQGAQLQFYSVDQEQFEQLTVPAMTSVIALQHDLVFHPLMAIKVADLDLALLTLNSKYPSRMDRATYTKYCNERDQLLSPLLIKLNEDSETVRDRYYNPGYQVGDLISSGTTFARIDKITEAGYSYQVYQPLFRIDRGRQVEQAKQFVKARAWGDAFDGSITIPYKGNEKWFALAPKRYNSRWTKYCNQVQTIDLADVQYSNSWSAN